MRAEGRGEGNGDLGLVGRAGLVGGVRRLSRRGLLLKKGMRHQKRYFL
jgi:hypothetical protein